MPPRVLLVDDCPVQRLLGLALFSRWRITPKLACDGEQAIVMAGAQGFDLILMDLDMPRIDGFAATRIIRQRERLAGRRSQVPVVAYTANDRASSQAEWFRSGMNEVLAKPCTAADMGACLVRWCPDALVVDGIAASA